MAGLPGSVGRIVQAMQERLPELLDRMAKRIRTEVPLYAGEDVVDEAGLHRSLRANVDYVLGGLLGGDTGDLSAPTATGRARATQGVPLVEMLAAYRLGFAEVWSELVATARKLPEATDAILVELAGEMFALQSRYADASVSGYRDEYREIVRTTAREHSALVEAVLAGSTSKGTLWEVAQALRLPLEGQFLVVAAESVELGHDPLPRIEPTLSALDVSSVWRLQPDQSVGVLALRRTTQAPSVLKTLTHHAVARIGVSPVFTRLNQASRALQLARLAMDRQEPGPGVEQIRDSPLSVLLASAPDAAIDAARSVIGGLLEIRKEDRDLLINTLLAWLDADGSANAAGAALFCHPNTVRYRLRRIEEATGRSLSAPMQLAELVTAVRAWSELPHQD
jgi:sugar diacid utilization regulator